jgi:anti-sigma B factor antagonist
MARTLAQRPASAAAPAPRPDPPAVATLAVWDAPGEGQDQDVEHPADMADQGGRPPQNSDPLSRSLRPRGPVRFGVTETHHEGAICLEIAGELDALTVPKLAAELNAVMRRSQENVTIDLRQAEFIDSSGLQLLLRAQRRLSQTARQLTVVCDEGPVRRVIELTRLGEILGLVSGDDAGDG